MNKFIPLTKDVSNSDRGTGDYPSNKGHKLSHWIEYVTHGAGCVNNCHRLYKYRHNNCYVLKHSEWNTYKRLNDIYVIKY